MYAVGARIAEGSGLTQNRDKSGGHDEAERCSDDMACERDGLFEPSLGSRRSHCRRVPELGLDEWFPKGAAASSSVARASDSLHGEKDPDHGA